MDTHMTDQTLTVERDGDVATVRFNRPDNYNALNQELLESLHETMSELAGDDQIRVVVLTGNGRAFCAGGDLKAVREADPEKPGDALHPLAGRFHKAVMVMRTMDKPVIAAINGPAAGGGMSLALACDLRVMAQGAILKIAYVENGLSIDGGGSFTLPRMVGLGRAMELAFMDEKISAELALELGLVNQVVPSDALAEATAKLADRLANMPTGALGRAKRLFNTAFDNTLKEQLDLEQDELAAAGNSDEGKEGMAAFFEKRKPKYR
jgi:2-(1,2-epoxy-1,2-dihydrophenyl)acetyl-CoA isomerase